MIYVKRKPIVRLTSVPWELPWSSGRHWLATVYWPNWAFSIFTGYTAQQVWREIEEAYLLGVGRV